MKIDELIQDALQSKNRKRFQELIMSAAVHFENKFYTTAEGELALAIEQIQILQRGSK